MTGGRSRASHSRTPVRRSFNLLRADQSLHFLTLLGRELRADLYRVFRRFTDYSMKPRRKYTQSFKRTAEVPTTRATSSAG